MKIGVAIVIGLVAYGAGLAVNTLILGFPSEVVFGVVFAVIGYIIA